MRSSTTSPFQSFQGVKPVCYFGAQSPNQHSCCVPVTLPAAQNLCSHPFSINCFSLEKQAISSPSWQHSHEEIPPPQPQPQGQSHNPSSSCIRPFPHLGSCARPSPSPQENLWLHSFSSNSSYLSSTLRAHWLRPQFSLAKNFITCSSGVDLDLQSVFSLSEQGRVEPLSSYAWPGPRELSPGWAKCNVPESEQSSDKQDWLLSWPPSSPAAMSFKGWLSPQHAAEMSVTQHRLLGDSSPAHHPFVVIKLSV